MSMDVEIDPVAITNAVAPIVLESPAPQPPQEPEDTGGAASVAAFVGTGFGGRYVMVITIRPRQIGINGYASSNAVVGHPRP